MIKMLCLDTYALAEISKQNAKFAKIMDEDIVIPDTTMAEFYWIILKEYDELTANYWYKQLSAYCAQVDKLIFIKAMKFRYHNKERKMSFFDCVGYIYARENNYKFVTGDKEFEKLPGVEFIKK